MIPGVWLLVFARTAVIVAVHPVFGGRALPRVTAVALAASLAVAVVVSRSGLDPQVPSAVWPLAVLFAKELFVGGVIGLLGRATFGAIEAAGRIVDDARGGSAAQSYAPQLEVFPSTLANLEVQVATALFWASNAHAGMIAVLADSFDAIPLCGVLRLHGGPVLELSLAIATALARAALGLAGPAASVCILADCLYGLVNRSAPQANVFFLSLPTKLLAAVLVTVLTAPARASTFGELWQLERGWASDLLGAK
jgi:type III secretory pathway component EscT